MTPGLRRTADGSGEMAQAAGNREHPAAETFGTAEEHVKRAKEWGWWSGRERRLPLSTRTIPCWRCAKFVGQLTPPYQVQCRRCHAPNNG